MTIEEHLERIDSLLEQLCGLMEVIADMHKEAEENAEKERIAEESRIDLLSLYDVNLLTKTRYALLRCGFKTVGQIRSLSARQILGLRGIGQQGLNDIKNMLAEYGKELTASVEKDNVYGCQFHPEKSGKVGLSILKAFCQIS